MTNPSPATPASPAGGGGGCPMNFGTGAVPLSGPGFHTEPHALYRTMRRDHGPVVPVEL
ncbi:cytochrome P450, partial [Streptomyces rubiginosohelvolus]